MRTENLAIMFTDIKGYTERTSKQSHRETSSLLKRHASLVVPIIEGFDGRVVKAIGDAFLVVFRSPTAAVLCGMTIQDQLHRHNHGRITEDQIHLRVAINVGEVLVSRGDVFGEPVNIASRVEGITPANEVYLTEAVYLAMNKSEVRAEPVDSFELKGVAEPVRVYRIPPTTAPRTDENSPVPSTSGPHSRELTNPSILLLPYGGVQLARLEGQFLTPARKRHLFIGSSILVASLILLLTVPPYLRQREWEHLEALIGRGETSLAIGALAALEHSGESERRRYLSLQQHLITRMLERGEADAAVAIMLTTDPQTPEEKAALMRLHHSLFEQLLQQGHTLSAQRLLDHATTRSTPEDKPLLEARIGLARALLQKGRLDELRTQLDLLGKLAPRDPRAKVLQGHLHVALSTREDRHGHLMGALGSYRDALSIELAAGDDRRISQNVAAAYNNDVKDARKSREILTTADALVDRFLRHRAVDALVAQLDQPNNTKEARDRLAHRIQQLGAEKEVDRVRLMLQDLESARCTNRSEAAATRRLIERLRDDGARDPRVVGALIAVGQRHDQCEPDALDAVHRIVGERVGFLSADDIKVRELVERLEDVSCRRKDRTATLELLAELVRMGDARAVGPVLKLGAEKEACMDGAQRAAEALLGKRVVFEASNETRFRELMDALRSGSCNGKNNAASLQDTIRAVTRHGDTRAVGELLELAKKGNSCAEPALAAARQLLRSDGLTHSCVHPQLADLRARRCNSKRDRAAAHKSLEVLLEEGDVKSAGELLQLAARRSACTELMLDGARKLTGQSELSLSCPKLPEVAATADAP